MLDQLSKNRQKKEFNAWRSSHRTKRAYRSRLHAWRAIVTLCLDKRRPDWHLQAYRCMWGSDWRHGRSYPVHWHIGHGRWGRLGNLRRRLRRKYRHKFCHFFVYPWLRLRSRVRIALKTRSLRKHPGYYERASR